MQLRPQDYGSDSIDSIVSKLAFVCSLVNCPYYRNVLKLGSQSGHKLSSVISFRGLQMSEFGMPSYYHFAAGRLTALAEILNPKACVLLDA